MNNLKEKKLNDKGFSLVELIIVIAIMAVLIGVLAPQYLKYVEKSRKSADEDNFQQIVSAVQVYYSDPTHTLPAANDYDVKVVSGKITTANIASEIDTACKDAGVTVTNITFKASSYQNVVLRFTVAADGTTKFTVDNEDLAKALAIEKHS